MISGQATREGTQQFVNRCSPPTAKGLYRQTQKLTVSNIGIGTYLGATDQQTDDAYVTSIRAALAGGINFIDTASNYRHQRSERAIAVALKDFFENRNGKREEVMICTKAGFVVPGATPENLKASDIVNGMHCLAPDFLMDQLERSRQNLNLETIDVFYLHNPEMQLSAVAPTDFYGRMRAAFERLERAVSDGLIAYYGTATWNGYRTSAANEALSLRTLDTIAREIAGDQHHFRFIQMPINVSMPEAFTRPVEGDKNMLDLASALSISVIASASLLQAELANNLSPKIAETFPGATTNAQRAIQFTRSTPGVSVALVGMSNPAHVMENLAIASVAPATQEEYIRLFQ
ncbi:MAG: aldo/keto reductase [Pseudomonadota bacterium]